MKRHLSACFAVTLFVIAQSCSATAKAAEQPNILFIFADDQCFNTLRSFGNEEVETPNLDRLVNSGTTFTHVYNQGGWNGAICIASRTMLSTGRFLWNAHKVDSRKLGEAERAAGRFWSEHMRKAGYDTYMSGKWHVKVDALKAFDVVSHVRPGMPKATPEGYNRPLSKDDKTWQPFDKKFGGFWEGGIHWSEVLGNDGEEFLARAAKRDKPFFMYLAFNAPHDPRQSPKEYVDKYPLDKISVPKNFLGEYPFNEGMSSGRKLRDERLAPFPRTKYSVKVNRQEYYAIITHMDHQIGRLLKALEKTGKADNTYIFFTADHGLACGQHGLMGKQNMYDHSIRVPFVVNGPRIDAGKKITSPIYLQDVMPTTLELAGVEKPKHVQFKSILPLLSGRSSRSYDAMYGAYLKGSQRMVTWKGHKLILYPNIKKARLFNLDADPNEINDLAGEAKQKDRMKELFAKLLELQVETGDDLDLKALYPSLL